ncbi:MAG: Fic family protein, partial [Nanoarchaeota archaeon]|nr:Fic family protein [Nanoarchaeota archaeon]
MFVEKRRQGKKTKYYLVHSYRLGGRIKRAAQFLGSDLPLEDIRKLFPEAEQSLLERIHSNRELQQSFSTLGKRLSVPHLEIDWKHFTEQFTYHTNAIEGSTVLLPEVRELLAHTSIPKDADQKETLNVAKAVDFIRTCRSALSVPLIKKLHLLCFQGTKPFAGKLRDVEVVIRNKQGEVIHTGAAAKLVPGKLAELCKWYALE